MKRERKAYCEGARANEIHHRASLKCQEMHNLATLQSEAVSLYPMPKVTRPRVVTDDTGREFRVFNGQMQTRHFDAREGRWVCLESPPVHVTSDGKGLRITADRVAMWADLFANPTESVDADAVSEES